MPDDLMGWLTDLVHTLDPPPPHLAERVHLLLLIARRFDVA
ncbi:hypothetical protein [Saccharothrix australiensis]|uniref:Uncharacterized protein n=1 Tax=Saccharothrix australiensis TaxID=2072 RepID=A0A495W716_9PSEU|nr:hypothetical protein [Saccharothrix australiensis]RKT56870.1 hypothetical protein C8E97_5583 [Saccharothrix australiensis]